MMCQALAGKSGIARGASEVSELCITATREGISGTTTLRMANEYTPESEMLNLPALLDSNWDPYPLVYTIGNNQAMQIQTVNAQTTIPLGIYSNSDEAVEVSFGNVDAFSGLALYDSKTDTSVAIDNDMTLTLPGSTNGRYLLTFSTSIDEEDLAESITISSIERGSIWVTSIH